jgi:pyroglutamyl-peptidase
VYLWHISTQLTPLQPFLDITTNPSWEVARQLPASLAGTNGETISIVVPADPTPAAYHKIVDQACTLVEENKLDVIIHLGLDVDSDPGVFKVERSAPKEGYHDIPDVNRKVFTRAENKQLFKKSPTSLVTTLDIDTAIEVCQVACASLSLPNTSVLSKAKSKGKREGRQRVDVRVSDDVGTYVCGFQYYMSLQVLERLNGRRDVVFLHVPKLEGEEEVSVGIRVAEELIKAMVGVWSQDKRAS